MKQNKQKVRDKTRHKGGMPKGHVTQKTISKEAAREAVREIVTRHMEKLVTAQLDNATGIKHLMVRDPKTGKFERIVANKDNPAMEEAQIDAALQSGGFWLYTKDPSVQAFTDLLNRAIDKPAEQVQVIEEHKHVHMHLEERISKVRELLANEGDSRTTVH